MAKKCAWEGGISLDTAVGGTSPLNIICDHPILSRRWRDLRISVLFVTCPIPSR